MDNIYIIVNSDNLEKHNQLVESLKNTITHRFKLNKKMNKYKYELDNLIEEIEYICYTSINKTDLTKDFVLSVDIIYKKLLKSLTPSEIKILNNIYKFRKHIDKNCNINCLNCHRCENCIDCINCFDSYNCFNCSNCEKSTNCRELINCEKCYDCYKCKRCAKCFKCTACERCETCKKCAGCTQCIDCEKCFNSYSCNKCLGSETCERCEYCEYCKQCKGDIRCKNCMKENNVMDKNMTQLHIENLDYDV